MENQDTTDCPINIVEFLRRIMRNNNIAYLVAPRYVYDIKINTAYCLNGKFQNQTNIEVYCGESKIMSGTILAPGTEGLVAEFSRLSMANLESHERELNQLKEQKITEFSLALKLLSS